MTDPNYRKPEIAAPDAHDFWIVTKKKYLKHGTLESAEAERDRLKRGFPDLVFHVHHCRSDLRARVNNRLVEQRNVLLAALKEALEWQTDDRDLTLSSTARKEDWLLVLAAREQMLRTIITKASTTDHQSPAAPAQAEALEPCA